jgi:L-lysine 2,3-aminomutase
MAHFNHPEELEHKASPMLLNEFSKPGVIRTQSPVLKHINDSPEIWAEMLKKQVQLGCIPYYMFVARNTGADHYFSIPCLLTYGRFSEVLIS